MIDRKLRNTALLVATCFFMEYLDGTIVTTAGRQIGESLNTSPASVSLVFTAYLLALTVLVPLSGWLIQRFASRLIFLSAIAIFTMASLGCALGIVLAGIALVPFLLPTRTPRTAGDNLRRR